MCGGFESRALGQKPFLNDAPTLVFQTLMHEIINPNFQAVPLAPITAPKPMSELDRLAYPPLAKRGCRNYLRRMRKLKELDLSSGSAVLRRFGLPSRNRASRRAHVKTLKFA